MTDDELVEMMAEALSVDQRQRHGQAPTVWGAELEMWRQECRARARAALAVAEPVIRERCARIALYYPTPVDAGPQLLDALHDALEALGGVLAWHLTPEEYHKNGLRAEDAAFAWNEARAAIKTARAALSTGSET